MTVGYFNQVAIAILAAVLDVCSLLQSLELICLYWFHSLLRKTENTGNILLSFNIPLRDPSVLL